MPLSLCGFLSIVRHLPVNVCGKLCDRVDSSIIGSYTELGINTHMSVESLLYSLSNITELLDITIYVRFLSLDLLVEGQVSVCGTKPTMY